METKKIIFGVLLFVITMSVLGYFMRYRLLEGTPWELPAPGEEKAPTYPVLHEADNVNPVEDVNTAENAAEVAPAEGVVEGEVVVDKP